MIDGSYGRLSDKITQRSREVLFIEISLSYVEPRNTITTFSFTDIVLAKCMNLKGKFQATLWRHLWRRHEKLFGIIWGGIFISEVKLKLCLIFQNFQNSRHFEATTNSFFGSDTGGLIYKQDSHEHFRYFELLIDALDEILR